MRKLYNCWAYRYLFHWFSEGLKAWPILSKYIINEELKKYRNFDAVRITNNVLAEEDTVESYQNDLSREGDDIEALK